MGVARLMAPSPRPTARMDRGVRHGEIPACAKNSTPCHFRCPIDHQVEHVQLAAAPSSRTKGRVGENGGHGGVAIKWLDLD